MEGPVEVGGTSAGGRDQWRRGFGAARRDGLDPNTTSRRRRPLGRDLHVLCLIERKVEKCFFFIEKERSDKNRFENVTSKKSQRKTWRVMIRTRTIK